MYQNYLCINVKLGQKRKILSISAEHAATCARKNHAVSLIWTSMPSFTIATLPGLPFLCPILEQQEVVSYIWCEEAVNLGR